MPHTFITKLHRETVQKKFAQFLWQTCNALACPGVDHLIQLKLESIRLNQPQIAERGPAQCKGILRSGRQDADAEKAEQIVELIREAYCDRCRRSRHLVARTDGLVMIANGLGHF